MNLLDQIRNAKAKIQKFIEPITDMIGNLSEHAIVAPQRSIVQENAIVPMKIKSIAGNPIGAVKKKILSFEEMLRKSLEPYRPKAAQAVPEIVVKNQSIAKVDQPKKLNFVEKMALAFAPFKLTAKESKVQVEVQPIKTPELIVKNQTTVQVDQPKKLNFIEKMALALVPFKPTAKESIVQIEVQPVKKPVSFTQMLQLAFSPFKELKIVAEQVSKPIAKVETIVPLPSAKNAVDTVKSQHVIQKEKTAEKMYSVKMGPEKTAQSEIQLDASQTETVSPFLAQILKKQQAIMKVVQERADKGEVIKAEKHQQEEEGIVANLKAKMLQRIESTLSNSSKFDENNVFDQEERAEQIRKDNAIKLKLAVDTIIEKPVCKALIENIVKAVISDDADNIHLIEDVVKQYENRLKADFQLSKIKLNEIQEINVDNGLADAANRIQFVIVDGLNRHAQAKACQELKLKLMTDLENRLELTDTIEDATLSGTIEQVLAKADVKIIADKVNTDILFILNNEGKYLNNKPVVLSAVQDFCQQNVAMIENKLALDKILIKNILDANKIEIVADVISENAQQAMLDELAKGLEKHRNQAHLDDSSDNDQNEWEWDNSDHEIRQLLLEDVIDMQSGIKGLEETNHQVELIHPAFTQQAQTENTLCCGTPMSTIETALEVAPIMSFFA